MGNIYKIEEELIEIINLIQHESLINPNFKHLIQSKLKKILFDVKVLKEILDENESYGNHNKTHKIPSLKNDNKKTSGVFNFSNNNEHIHQLFERFSEFVIPVDVKKNNNNNKDELDNEQSLENIDNELDIETNNLKKINSIENISLIPKNNSNSSFLSSDLDLDK